MWKYPGVKGTDSAIHFEVNLKKKKIDHRIDL